jgi:hypothetical protein
MRRATVDEGREAPFKEAIYAGSAHGRYRGACYQGARPLSTRATETKSAHRL